MKKLLFYGSIGAAIAAAALFATRQEAGTPVPDKPIPVQAPQMEAPAPGKLLNAQVVPGDADSTDQQPSVTLSVPDEEDEVFMISDHPERWKGIRTTTPEWIAANFVLPQIPFNGQCQKLTFESGESICWEQYENHPYLQYSIDALLPIAHEDAEAAAALAVMFRHDNDEASFYYAYLASELSGKMGPLVNYIRSAAVTSTDVDELLDLYALARVVEANGYDRPLAAEYKNFLRGQGLTNKEIVAAAKHRHFIADPALQSIGGVR